MNIGRALHRQRAGVARFTSRRSSPRPRTTNRDPGKGELTLSHKVPTTNAELMSRDVEPLPTVPAVKFRTRRGFAWVTTSSP